jgi:zinc protease
MRLKRLTGRGLPGVLVVVILWAWSGGPLAAMPPVQRIVLPNKLVLLVSEEHSLPFVTLHMIVDAGSRRDPSGQEGLAHLTAKGLLLGTDRQPLQAINEALDFLGADLGTSATEDLTAVSLRVLKKDLEKGFSLFLNTVTRPAFPWEELAKEATKILGAIQAVEEQPEAVAEKAFRRLLFSGNPYGHPVEGTKDSVPSLTRDRVEQFYRTFYHPNNAVLAVVGDITLEEVQARLVPLLSQWPAVEVATTPFNSSFTKGPETIRISRDLTQATIIMGHIGVERANPDYYALTVLNYILGGGGFGSRLMDEIRVKKGLAYSVASFFEAKQYQGSFQVILQTKNTSAKEAISLALKEMEQLRQEPLSKEAVQRAQNYLVGSFPLRLDTQGKLAGFLTLIETYGLGLDYPERYASLIRSVTPAEVLRVARTYLHPDQAILVVVGNLNEAGLEPSEPK